MKKDIKSFSNKFKLKRVSSYARKMGVSRETVRLWIKQDKLDYIDIDGIKFVIEK